MLLTASPRLNKRGGYEQLHVLTIESLRYTMLNRLRLLWSTITFDDIAKAGLPIVFLILLGMGLYAWRGSLYLITQGQPAVAVCERVETKTVSSGGDQTTRTVYHVRFRDRENRVQRAEFSRFFLSLRQGDEVKILYDPQQPQHAIVNNVLDLWATPTLLTLFGGGLLAGSFRDRRKRRRRKRVTG